MKTAYIYPGLNGLLRRTDRVKFLALPEVQARFKTAEVGLASQAGVKIDFNELLSRPTEEIYALENVSLAAIAICAIQCGISDRLKQTHPQPDWLMGCSMGDLARAVHAGAYDYETAVVNYVRFTRDIFGLDQIGKNIAVSAPKGESFSADDYAWFDEIEVDVSRLNPRMLNIGGRFAELALIEERAASKGWNTLTLLDYPAHSRYILPYVEKVEVAALDIRTQPPSIPIFSSISLRSLSDPDEIKREFLLSISQTLQWDQAVTRLVQDHGITRFVNIGPCRSLSGVMKDLAVEAEMVEAYDLMELS